jgi:dihydropyrimidinase
MSILVRNATVLTSQEKYLADIAVTGDKISGIGPDLAPECDIEIDASGMFVCPGGIDPHCHPGDDFDCGSVAAACGGSTCLIEPSVQEQGKGLTEAVDAWQHKADHNAAIDYSFHVTIVDANKQALDDIPRLVERGVTSFKIFMASFPGTPMLNDGEMLGVLALVRDVAGIVILHAENGHLIEFLTAKALSEGRFSTREGVACHPRVAEAEAVNRAITLAGIIGTPLFFYHVSCAKALDEIRSARASGSAVYAETCPHYLFLTEEVYEQESVEAAKYYCAPPLRDSHDQSELWKALQEGTIQVVSSDHVGLNMRGQKDLARVDFTRVPLGIPGIGTRVPLVFSAALEGRISLTRFVDLVSTAPAKLFGLYPRKGEIRIGSDADLIVLDPKLETVVRKDSFGQSFDYSPYEGIRLRGGPKVVISRGKIVVEDGQFLSQERAGEFIPRLSPVMPE